MSLNFTPLVDVETLAQQIGDADWRIIVCRLDLLGRLTGYIPGPVNLSFTDLRDACGKFLTHGELRTCILQKVTNTPTERVDHGCGSGAMAYLNILAMEIIGLLSSRLYAGAWGKRLRDPVRSMLTQKVS